MVRRKFITPAAEATSFSSTAPSARVVSGTKKNGRPAPWKSCGSASVQKSASLVHQKTRTSEVAPSQKIPPETSSRGSIFCDSMAAIGAIRTAEMPVKAVA